jgi:hypothetical protein
MGLFNKREKFNVSILPDVVIPEGISDGPALLLLSQENGFQKLMYATNDVMEGETLIFEKLFKKYGYAEDLAIHFDGFLLIGEIKGRYFYPDQVIDFKDVKNRK